MGWKLDGVNHYLKKSDELLDLLFLIIHITSGQPARGPEILEIRLWNTATTRRNIHVIDGRILRKKVRGLPWNMSQLMGFL